MTTPARQLEAEYEAITCLDAPGHFYSRSKVLSLLSLARQALADAATEADELRVALAEAQGPDAAVLRCMQRDVPAMIPDRDGQVLLTTDTHVRYEALGGGWLGGDAA